MPVICMEGLLWLLQATHPSALYQCLTADGALRRVAQVHGFKLSEQCVSNEHYGRLLALQLMSEPELLSSLLQALLHCRWWQNRARHCLMLDKEWLLQNWRPLLESVADPRPWAMFMAERYAPEEKGHRLGTRLRRCPSLWRPPADKATGGPLTGILQYFRVSGEPVPATASREQRVQNELEHFRHQSAHKYSQIQAEMKQREEELATLRREGEALKKTLRDLQRNSAEQLRAATGEMEAARQAERQSLLQIELGLLPALPPLLHDAQETRQELAGRVEAALARQAERNARYGLKCHIRQELGSLQQVQKNLQLAIDDAVSLAPELLPLLAEVEDRVSGLQRRLDTISPAPVIPDRLRTALYSIPLDRAAPPLLAEFEHCLNSRMAQTLLLPDEAAALRQQLSERQRLWSTVHQPDSSDAVLPAKELWRLDGYADSFAQTEIFVDFYNLLLQDPVLGVLGRHASGLAEARRQLIERCRKLSRRFQRVVLVLDSPEAIGSQQEDARLSIIYAAATESGHNADNKLLEMLQSAPAGPRWLVSDDLGLRARAERHCSAVVHTVALRALLLQDGL